MDGRIVARVNALGLARQRGQGTVEYLGLLLAIGALLLAVKSQFGLQSGVAKLIAERFGAILKTALH